MITTEKLTYLQRNGHQPLPQRLKLGEMDQAARGFLTRWVSTLIQENSRHDDFFTCVICDPLKTIFQDIWIDADYLNRGYETFSDDEDTCRRFFLNLIEEQGILEVINILDAVVSHSLFPKKFRDSFAEALMKGKVAYRLDISTGQIFPIASPEEGMVIQEALRLTQQEGMQAVRGHLLSAGKYINQGDWRDSVRESIHAVEAVGRLILKNPSTTLGEFIKSCDKCVNIHPQLKEMLKKFSTYANDHARHADKPDSSTPPDMADAVLLFGSCASFVTYLINKSGLNGAAEVS